MFIEVEYRGEVLKVRLYSLRTSFSISSLGPVTFSVDGLDENGHCRILYSSHDALEAWEVYQKLWAMCDKAAQEAKDV